MAVIYNERQCTRYRETAQAVLQETAGHGNAGRAVAAGQEEEAGIQAERGQSILEAPAWSHTGQGVQETQEIQLHHIQGHGYELASGSHVHPA